MVDPPELSVLSLCSGAGGLELGLSLVVRTHLVAAVERDTFAAAVLLARMEDEAMEPAPVWCGDLARLDASPFAGVDLVCAGFPCPPFSAAGKRQGTDDARWLWPDIAGVVRQVGPRFVFLENVRGLLVPAANQLAGIGHVLRDLADLGFDAEWGVLSAAAVGAPHRRERVFILGWRRDLEHAAIRLPGDRRAHDAAAQRGRSELEAEPSATGREAVAHARRIGSAGRGSAGRGEPGDVAGPQGDVEGGEALAHPNGSGGPEGIGQLQPWEPDALGVGQNAGAEPRCSGARKADPESVGEREPHDERGTQPRQHPRQIAGGSGGQLGDTQSQGREGDRLRRLSPQPGPSRPWLWPPGPDDAEGWAELLRAEPGLEPAVRRRPDELPAGVDESDLATRLDQLRVLGNAVVPACAGVAFALLARRAGLTP